LFSIFVCDEVKRAKGDVGYFSGLKRGRSGNEDGTMRLRVELSEHRLYSEWGLCTFSVKLSDG